MKIQTVIRLDEDLLEMAKAEAKAQKRSLDNYIEHLLYQEFGTIPNKERKKTIYDNHYDLNITRVEGFDKWIESLLNGKSED